MSELLKIVSNQYEEVRETTNIKKRTITVKSRGGWQSSYIGYIGYISFKSLLFIDICITF